MVFYITIFRTMFQFIIRLMSTIKGLTKRLQNVLQWHRSVVSSLLTSMLYLKSCNLREALSPLFRVGSLLSMKRDSLYRRRFQFLSFERIFVFCLSDSMRKTLGSSGFCDVESSKTLFVFRIPYIWRICAQFWRWFLIVLSLSVHACSFVRSYKVLSVFPM